MGRASRLKESLDKDNRGNRLRGLWARAECLRLLEGDPRIQAHFQGWMSMMDQLARDFPPQFRPAARERFELAEINFMAGVLRDIGVPFAWCAPVLVGISFPAMRLNARRRPGDLLHGYTATVDLRGVPRGQAPPHDGTAIEENVRWWYRRKIKDPKDDLSVIVAEYATREKRGSEAHSTVLKGIERAETLLPSDFLGWRDI